MSREELTETFTVSQGSETSELHRLILSFIDGKLGDGILGFASRHKRETWPPFWEILHLPWGISSLNGCSNPMKEWTEKHGAVRWQGRHAHDLCNSWSCWPATQCNLTCWRVCLPTEKTCKDHKIHKDPKVLDDMNLSMDGISSHQPEGSSVQTPLFWLKNMAQRWGVAVPPVLLGEDLGITTGQRVTWSIHKCHRVTVSLKTTACE